MHNHAAKMKSDGELGLTRSAVRNVTYVCCGCRTDHERIFFELCSEQRPDLVLRSKGDIFFFDMCFDLEVEHWADVAGHQAMEQLRLRTA